jgi:hypothetical protein
MIIKVCFDDGGYSDSGCWKFFDPIMDKWVPLTQCDDPAVVPGIEEILLRPGQEFDVTRDDTEVCK